MARVIIVMHTAVRVPSLARADCRTTSCTTRNVVPKFSRYRVGQVPIVCQVGLELNLVHVWQPTFYSPVHTARGLKLNLVYLWQSVYILKDIVFLKIDAV